MIDVVPIGKTTLYISDGNYSSKYPKKHEFLESGIPFVSSNNLQEGRIAWDNMKYISSKQHTELKKGHLKTGDVLLVTRGNSIGTVAYVTEEFEDANINAQLVLLRADNQTIDSRYLYHLVSSREFFDAVINHASGTAQPQLPIGPLKLIPIWLHDYPTQRRIASILSAYDDLIENNMRRIKILEQMAQAIYREWFVEFRAPGVKLRKATSEEQKVTAKDRFPVGWEIGRLDDALVLQRGFDLPKGQRQEGNVPVYAATGIVGAHDEAKVKGPGVVTGRSGSLGTVLYIEEDFWPLNTALWVKEFRHSTPILAYYLLSSLELSSFNSGAAVPTLNRNDIHGLPVVLPGRETLEQFDAQLTPMFTLKRCLTEKNANLRQTRDLLLPRLVGGEIRIEPSADGGTD
jgi:type I restriction enzyme, S subunit